MLSSMSRIRSMLSLMSCICYTLGFDQLDKLHAEFDELHKLHVTWNDCDDLARLSICN